MKKLFRLIIILFLGGIGGVVLERTLVPWLANHEPFSRIPRLTIERVTVVNPKEEIIIDRAQALERAVGAVRPSLVRVERRDERGVTRAAASGVVFTGDGMIVTDAAIVTPAASAQGIFVVLRDHDSFAAEFIRRDTATGIAIFRGERSGLPVTDLVEDRDFVLGKSVFLLHAADGGEEGVLASVTPGVITGAVIDGVPETDIVLDRKAAGAPMFTIEGRLLGVVVGQTIVPVAVIRALIEE